MTAVVCLLKFCIARYGNNLLAKQVEVREICLPSQGHWESWRPESWKADFPTSRFFFCPSTHLLTSFPPSFVDVYQNLYSRGKQKFMGVLWRYTLSLIKSRTWSFLRKLRSIRGPCSVFAHTWSGRDGAPVHDRHLTYIISESIGGRICFLFDQFKSFSALRFKVTILRDLL